MSTARQYRDINQAYFSLQHEKQHLCEWEETRNGRAFVFQDPILITHLIPGRRVLFDPARNANPFFHYMEAIWMLAGGREVGFLTRFAENIQNYSDDGETLHGAYGYRWRHQFQVIPPRMWQGMGVNPGDQIEIALSMLRKDPNSRRVVLQMWDAELDLNRDSKDLPCNTHIYVRIQNGALDITVCNRSNDLVWGMLGANYVHFTVLQEYMALALGIPVGYYHHFTNNLHVYEAWTEKYSLPVSTWYDDHPAFQRVQFSPETFPLDQAKGFIYSPDRPLQDNTVLSMNARPMLNAWDAWKKNDLDLAKSCAGMIYDDDWRQACLEWLGRKG